MFGASLLVSIPGSQVASLALPGSLFGWRHLRDAALAPELRLALLLVMQEAAARRTRVTFVARPEIFTHGRARAWLDARTGGTEDHLTLTDGHSLRVLPGLRNHMFFYPRGMPGPEGALRRLLSVAPEIFAGLAGQVNGTLAFRLGARWLRPPVLALRFAATPRAEASLRAPFLCRPGNPARSAALCAEAAVEPASAPPAGRPVHYVPLSEAALADAPFLAALARAAQHAALGRAEEALLLGLPRLEREEAELPDQVGAVLHALAGTGLPLPRTASWAVRLALGPPTAAELAGGRVTLHPGTAFWRLGADLFEGVREVAVAGSGALAPFRALLAGWLGREVALRRPGAEPGRVAVTLGTAP